MADFTYKNMFVMEHSRIGEVEYFITKYVCGSGGVPAVSMPFLKPNGEYGHISVKNFTRTFDDKFRITMYKTSNKHLNRLFKNNEYYNIWNKPGQSIEIWIKHKGETIIIDLGEYEFTIRSEYETIHPEILTYGASKKVIFNALDSMVRLIQVMTE